MSKLRLSLAVRGMVAVGLALTFIAASETTAAEQRVGVEKASCRVLLQGPFPVGTGPCFGVRPGASAIGGCTLNFIFEGDDGYHYVGTAGHCMLRRAGGGPVSTNPQTGEKSWRPGTGPTATDRNGKRIGEYAYAVHESGANGYRDFGLIRLDPGVKAKAKMCHFGGPARIAQEPLAPGTLLHHYGNGYGIGTIPTLNQPVLPARSAITAMSDRRIVGAYGAATFGDSGSPVITADGGAVGVLVGINAAGALTITRLGPQVRRAEKVSAIDLKMRTASLH